MASGGVSRSPWTIQRQDCTIEGTLWTPEQTPRSAVVVSHGFSANRYALEEFAGALAEEDHLVYAFDARGHGATAGEIDFPAMVEDLDTTVTRVAEEFGIRNIGLLGHSMGGMLSISVAIQNPRVSALAVMAATVNPLDDLHTYFSFPGAVQMSTVLREYLERGGLDFTLPPSLFTDRWLIGEYMEALRDLLTGKEDVVHGVRRLTNTNIQEWYLAFKKAPRVREFAAEITVPFLSIHGTADRSVPIRTGKEFYEAVGSGDKKFVEVSKAPHWLYLTHKDETLPKVVEFFGRTLR